MFQHMCAVFERKGIGFRPGRPVRAVKAEGVAEHIWAGFARSEILAWWQSKGGVLVDIPADRFAERSNITGKLIWDDVPEGFVIRGLVDVQEAEPLIKIVTRAASQEEEARFQHPRMPLLETPLFPWIRVPDVPKESGFLF
jgi:hypothetical protein